VKVGAFTISAIDTGDFRLDGGAMFGVVPKVLWNRTNSADDLNRIAMTCRALLIESPERKILVDAGIGDKDGEKFADLYAVDFSRTTLLASLARRGITPDDVTDVIITHLHFDHVGGCTRFEHMTAVPTFPRARHYVQKEQLRHALNPSDKDRASYFPQNYRPLQEAGLLELVEGNVELFAGIDVIVVNGHTPAMQTVRVRDGGQTAWYAADLLPMSAHVPLPYIMGYDCWPMITLEEKKALLPQAVDEEWIVVYEHDPLVEASKIAKHEKGFFTRGDPVSL
jgi:glyoxylase-like metal-dependent hydrolase (beta-lactamase superfamily II)